MADILHCSAGIKTSPLTLEVHKRKDVLADVTDRGFSPHLVRIDEGNAVLWKWDACSIPHTVSEVKYSMSARGLLPVPVKNGKKIISTRTGTYRHQFE